MSQSISSNVDLLGEVVGYMECQTDALNAGDIASWAMRIPGRRGVQGDAVLRAMRYPGRCGVNIPFHEAASRALMGLIFFGLCRFYP